MPLGLHALDRSPGLKPGWSTLAPADAVVDTPSTLALTSTSAAPPMRLGGSLTPAALAVMPGSCIAGKR